LNSKHISVHSCNRVESSGKIPWLLATYPNPALPTDAGELAGIVAGETDKLNGECAAPLPVVLTGNKGWETWGATGEGTPVAAIGNDV
jgi:hypothetical protein